MGLQRCVDRRRRAGALLLRGEDSELKHESRPVHGAARLRAPRR